MIKHCAHCGKEFEIKNRFCGSQRYCSPECRNEADRERIKRNNDSRPKKPQEPTPQKRCKRYGCLYHPAKNAPNGCDYTLVTGKLRGCPAGEGCTCYKRGTPEDRKRLQVENVKNGYLGW